MKPNKPKPFINRTSYPGGIKALRAFIDKELKYPQEAIHSKTSGTVTVKFSINNKGLVFNPTIVHSIGFGCDDEALRLVLMLHYAKTVNRGLHVVFHETIHIHFNLAKYLQLHTITPQTTCSCLPFSTPKSNRKGKAHSHYVSTEQLSVFLSLTSKLII
jgi:TonB family protein